ncbi:MAG: c-type cytochrome domain-containing protein, partial [Pseudomonadota bacterium]
MRRPLALALVAGLAAAGAAAGGGGCDDLGGTPIVFGVDWSTDIKPLFNELVSPEGRCTSCHNAGQPAGGLDLSDTGFDAIYKLVNLYVIPGEPEASVLFTKINCAMPPTGQRMPLG